MGLARKLKRAAKKLGKGSGATKIAAEVGRAGKKVGAEARRAAKSGVLVQAGSAVAGVFGIPVPPELQQAVQAKIDKGIAKKKLKRIEKVTDEAVGPSEETAQPEPSGAGLEPGQVKAAPRIKADSFWARLFRAIKALFGIED